MDRVNNLSQIVRREVQDYSGLSIGSTTYAINDEEQHLYAVAIIPDHPRSFKSRIMLMARVVGDTVIIEEDTTDRPLVHELEHAGIPRSHIILAYAGEAVTA